MFYGTSRTLAATGRCSHTRNVPQYLLCGAGDVLRDSQWSFHLTGANRAGLSISLSSRLDHTLPTCNEIKLHQLSVHRTLMTKAGPSRENQARRVLSKCTPSTLAVSTTPATPAVRNRRRTTIPGNHSFVTITLGVAKCRAIQEVTEGLVIYSHPGTTRLRPQCVLGCVSHLRTGSSADAARRHGHSAGKKIRGGLSG